jgi:YidC/Oxa1 family membrane protein insertase
MTKNLVAFVALSFAIIVGWSYLQRQLWPVKPADAKKDPVAVAKVPDKNKTETPNKDDKNPAKGNDDDKKNDAKDGPKAVEPIPAPAEVASYTLGGQESYLSVVVTNLGAGVRKLTLTRFEAANYLGQPADPKRELEFVQDDPFMPSFRMYHFPEADSEQPVFGLGNALWNVVGDGVEKDGDGWKIAFWTLVPDRRELKITKTFRLQPNDYHVGLSIEIQHLESGAGKASFRYQMTASHGLPMEGEWYTPLTMIRNAVVGVLDERDNLYRTIEDAARVSAAKEGQKVPAGDSWIQYAGVMTQYFASVIVVDPKQPFGDWKKAPSILQSARPTQESKEVKATLVSVADDAVVFLDGKGDRISASLLPRAKEHLEVLKLRAGSKCVVSFASESPSGKAIVHWFRLGQTPIAGFDDLTVRVNSAVVTVAAGDKVSHNFLLYHGPVKTKLLGQNIAGSKVAPELVDKYTYQLHLNTLTDYSSANWIRNSPLIFWTDLLIACTNLMHFLLYYLHYLAFGNWGLSIILLTIVVRGAMFPISRKQAIMSQKMQALAPEIKKLQEKYKDDKQGQAQATMELYRKHKVSPAGGCLPLLLQMPIFMGLYYCLQESVQFRLAKFLWIDNLAAPDMLFWWGQSIPYISDPDSLGGMLYLGPFFNLLPVIAVGFMVVQQKLMAPPPQNEEQEVQQKTMQIMMGVMGIFFYKVAAGLCLYFIASSLWGVVERKMLPKKSVAISTTPTAPVKPINNGWERRRDRDRAKKEPETAVTKLKSWWQKLLDSAEKK